jgi:hypothetical protein
MKDRRQCCPSAKGIEQARPSIAVLARVRLLPSRVRENSLLGMKFFARMCAALRCAVSRSRSVSSCTKYNSRLTRSAAQACSPP